MKSKIQNPKSKIVFIGTPEFGAVVLEELAKSEYKPVLVVTAPDKLVGRKQILTPPPVKVLAERYKIPVEQPENVSIIIDQLSLLKPDLIIVAAYGQILPKDILDIPKYGCLNVHPSPLPRWRGPSPVQFTILEGDEETGVTIIKMTEKVDAGSVIANSKFRIPNPKVTYEELHNKLAELGAKLLIETIPRWIKGEIKPKPQNEARATYTKILRKEDGKINWKNSAEYIEKQVRAFNQWPGAFALVDGKNLKILKASVLEQTKNGPFGPPGKTFLAPNDKIAVQTGKDYLIIEDLQLAGKRKMLVGEFLRGHSDFIGTILK